MARRLLAGSLDRAVDVAATLELRGYGRTLPRLREERRRSRFDARFYAVAAVLLLATLSAALGGLGGFDAYPSLAVDADPATLAFALLVTLTGLAPRRG
jgi:energy-coupling factor transport system permease protein